MKMNFKNSDHRAKQCVLKLCRHNIKSIIWDLNSDARNYNKHIKELEREQKEFLQVSKDKWQFSKP
jgi:hypothetical protein